MICNEVIILNTLPITFRRLTTSLLIPLVQVVNLIKYPHPEHDSMKEKGEDEQDTKGQDTKGQDMNGQDTKGQDMNGQAPPGCSQADAGLAHDVNGSTNEASCVSVKTEDGSIFIADAVIVTVPLGVLKSGAISFRYCICVCVCVYTQVHMCVHPRCICVYTPGAYVFTPQVHQIAKPNF